MADITLVSYDLKGKQLSFANWISNLSPDETPFVSMTSKESISQTLFQWQTDTLETAVVNAVVEGSVAEAPLRKTTTTLTNVTQILRKVVKVSDTSTYLHNYGRGNELKYQLDKAGKEIKRDLEVIFLSAQARVDGNGTTIARKTDCFQRLVAPVDAVDPDTGAVVHRSVTSFTEGNVFDVTYNLYMSGSKANIIMFHPKYASFFASFMETGSPNRVKMFDGGDTKYNKYVSEIVDPLGCTYKLIPNRWMPDDVVYFFTPSDWTQMILRAPERTKLAKDGSYDKWMIEVETGLRHRHPFASGILKIKPEVPTVQMDKAHYYMGMGGSLVDEAQKNAVAVATVSGPTTQTIASAVSSNTGVATVAISGKNINITGVGAGTTTVTVTTNLGATTTFQATVHNIYVGTASIPNMDIGQTRTATYTTDPANAGGTGVWTSDDPTTITIVPATGVITAIKAGFTRARLTYTLNGVRFADASGVTVNAAAPAAMSLMVEESDQPVAMKAGQTRKMKVTTVPEDSEIVVGDHDSDVVEVKEEEE